MVYRWMALRSKNMFVHIEENLTRTLTPWRGSIGTELVRHGLFRSAHMLCWNDISSYMKLSSWRCYNCRGEGGVNSLFLEVASFDFAEYTLYEPSTGFLGPKKDP